jgi:hypothetical protein
VYTFSTIGPPIAPIAPIAPARPLGALDGVADRAVEGAVDGVADGADDACALGAARGVIFALDLSTIGDFETSPAARQKSPSVSTRVRR